MSVVVKEYICPIHGYFESRLPICTTCGTLDVQRTFTQPPAFKGDKTKNTDKELKGLTEAYGLTDFSNNQNTAHERPLMPHNEQSKLVEAGVLCKNPDGWESVQSAQGLLAGAGISIRQPTEQERAKPTVLKPAAVNKAFKGKMGSYIARSEAGEPDVKR